jgi:hypothetical protein
LAGEPKLDRKAISQIGKLVDVALESAEAAGYRIDRLLGTAVEAGVPEAETPPAAPDQTDPHEPDAEPVKPVD